MGMGDGHNRDYAKTFIQGTVCELHGDRGELYRLVKPYEKNINILIPISNPINHQTIRLHYSSVLCYMLGFIRFSTGFYDVITFDHLARRLLSPIAYLTYQLMRLKHIDLQTASLRNREGSESSKMGNVYQYRGVNISPDFSMYTKALFSVSVGLLL